MSLSSELKNFIKTEIPKQHAIVVGNVEDYVYNFIIAHSPVDTGAYRANHHRTADSPNYSFDKNKTNNKEPKPVITNGFKTFYVANGAPYAQALEEGHSDQGKHIYGVAYSSAKAKFRL